MNACDVLIVGGGPAGSTLARSLDEAGLDVAIMDARTFPRDKVCAGWITPAVVESLRLDVEEYRHERVLQPIHGFRVGTIGGREVSTRRHEEPLSYGIRRVEFDDYLLRRAPVHRLVGHRLERLERENGRWVVNGEIRAALVVGAGGHFCPVARSLGAGQDRNEPCVAAQEVEFELSPSQRRACGVDPEIPELFFCDDLRGYGWAFRKGDHLNVGLGREGGRGLAGHVSKFVDFLVERGKAPPDMPRRFKGHAYVLYTRGSRRVVDDGALLIGDAAGLAYPESGEGIRPAVESALLAADAIIAADGDYRRERLEPYRESLEGRFGPRRPGRGATRLLPRRLKQVLASYLLRNRRFVQRVVIERWFLHAHVPALDGRRLKPRRR